MAGRPHPRHLRARRWQQPPRRARPRHRQGRSRREHHAAREIDADDDSMSVSLSKTGNIALIRQSFDRPPEVWAGPSDTLQQITHLNDASQTAWGKTGAWTRATTACASRAGCSIPPPSTPPRNTRWSSACTGARPATHSGWPTFNPAIPSQQGYFVLIPIRAAATARARSSPGQRQGLRRRRPARHPGRRGEVDPRRAHRPARWASPAGATAAS